MTYTSGLAALALLTLIVAPAYAGNSVDDPCPDQGGTAFIVDSPMKASIVANTYHRPDCHLVIKTSLDRSTITDTTLRITAKSVTIEGPVEISNSRHRSRIVITAMNGDITITSARLLAKREVLLECLGPATCTVALHRNALVQAPKIIRILSQGTAAIEEGKLETVELDIERGTDRH
jgi:hypothetical protein